jgi:hypothetical protein
MKENKPTPTPALENESRRKAVKTIVGGVTVLAAYHTLPVKWGTPIIEQVFLPAHAATSGSSLHDPCTVTRTDGPEDTFLVEGFVTPPIEGLPTTIVLTPSVAGVPGSPQTATTNTLADGTFSATITIASGSDRVDVTTTVEGADGSASCFSVKPGEESPPEEKPRLSYEVDIANNNNRYVNVQYDNPSGDRQYETYQPEATDTIFVKASTNTLVLNDQTFLTFLNGAQLPGVTGGTVVIDRDSTLLFTVVPPS